MCAALCFGHCPTITSRVLCLSASLPRVSLSLCLTVSCPVRFLSTSLRLPPPLPLYATVGYRVVYLSTSLCPLLLYLCVPLSALVSSCSLLLTWTSVHQSQLPWPLPLYLFASLPLCLSINYRALWISASASVVPFAVRHGGWNGGDLVGLGCGGAWRLGLVQDIEASSSGCSTR